MSNEKKDDIDLIIFYRNKEGLIGTKYYLDEFDFHDYIMIKRNINNLNFRLQEMLENLAGFVHTKTESNVRSVDFGEVKKTRKKERG